MEWRYFDRGQDLEATIRIWHEIGWLNRDTPGARPSMETYTAATCGYTGLVHGLPECLVFRTPGTLRYQQTDLPLAAITGVATGRNARKQGLAIGLTARAVAEAAAEGAVLAGLSTFEQGFYNRIGFGNGAYQHIWRLDPARLTVSDKVRPPHHLHPDQSTAMHHARIARLRTHGSVSLDSPRMTESAVLRSPNGFGLGYFDDGPETPSHFLWCSAPQTVRGPYTIEFMAWKSPSQFLELMGIIKQWGDQVRLVVMSEPAGIQVQDILDRPTQHFWSTVGGEFASFNRAHASFQYRILDLAACVRAARLPGPELTFNLELHDPIAEHAPDDIDWRVAPGSYRVTLGPASDVEPGAAAVLPTLTASVGAFTRLWLGVRPATGLAVTDVLAGPRDLLEALDAAFCLPTPVTDWQY